MRYMRFNPEDHIGEKFRACHLCGGHWSETDGDTSETNYYGRLYPESLLVERDGRWYCSSHYNWRFNKKDTDEPFDMPDSDRQGPEKGTVDA
jgi:hypothetical protein